MKLIGLVVALVLGASAAEAAKDCNPAQKAEALAPASQKDRAVRLTCNLTLLEGERVTKRIVFRGNGASGVKLVCRGGKIGAVGERSLFRGQDLIVIRSVKASNGGWSRPENVLIDGCVVNGAIRVFGLGPNGQAEGVKASSRKANHTKNAQNAAPRGIVLRNLTVRGDGRIPIYFGPGVTQSQVTGSTIVGKSSSSGLYLDAESAGNTISGNVFDVATPREILSIDGSAGNLVEGNRFERSDLGGVYVYRNCGEGGVARHQKPERNLIRNNTFTYAGSGRARPTIWLSFSNIQRTVFLCPQDRGIPYGSGTDDRNFANHNTVSKNTFVRSPIAEVIRNGGAGNKLSGNKRK